MYFDGVHRISTCARDGRDSEPRPIIVKLSAFQDKKNYRVLYNKLYLRHQHRDIRQLHKKGRNAKEAIPRSKSGQAGKERSTL